MMKKSLQTSDYILANHQVYKQSDYLHMQVVAVQPWINMVANQGKVPNIFKQVNSWHVIWVSTTGGSNLK